MPERKDSDRVQIGLRLREGMRRELEAKAKAHAISINAEIELRLDRSFWDEERHQAELYDWFRGPRNYALAHVIARMAGSLEPTDSHTWADNENVFVELRKAINALLDGLAPPAGADGPESVVDGTRLADAWLSHFKIRSPMGHGTVDIKPSQDTIDARAAYEAGAELRRLIERRK